MARSIIHFCRLRMNQEDTNLNQVLREKAVSHWQFHSILSGADKPRPQRLSDNPTVEQAAGGLELVQFGEDKRGPK
jgi:hypothetical protein